MKKYQLVKKNRKLSKHFVMTSVLLVLLLAGSISSVSAQTKSAAAKAPDFTLKLLNGKDATLSKLNDKIVLINFWATWCGYCVKEFPDLQELWNEYGEDMHILAVNVGENKKAIEEFLKKTPYSFPIVMDSDTRVSSLYKVSGIPVTYIIGKDGTILFSRVGMMSKKDMISAVEESLKK